MCTYSVFIQPCIILDTTQNWLKYHIQVIVPYKAGPRKFQIRTPSRKKSISRITRKSYVSVASAVINSPSTTASVVKKIAAKIKGEMKDLSSISYDSILTDSVEAIKQFSWELVYTELVKKVPTLMSLLSQLINKPKDHKPLLCCLASQILKCKHQRLCLVQRVISVMLYGYGTAKQVRSLCGMIYTHITHPSWLVLI